MWNDPIIDELHRVREKLMREAGGDLHEAIVRAHAFNDPSRLVLKGTPRRPAGWVEGATPLPRSLSDG